MLLHYKPSGTTLKARLRQTAAGEVHLVVRYGGEVEVTHLEARYDFEVVRATRRQLEELQTAGYSIPLAATFRKPAARASSQSIEMAS